MIPFCASLETLFPTMSFIFTKSHFHSYIYRIRQVKLTPPPANSIQKKPSDLCFSTPEIWLEKIYTRPIFSNRVRGRGYFKLTNTEKYYKIYWTLQNA